MGEISWREGCDRGPGAATGGGGLGSRGAAPCWWWETGAAVSCGTWVVCGPCAPDKTVCVNLEPFGLAEFGLALGGRGGHGGVRTSSSAPVSPRAPKLITSDLAMGSGG